VYILTATFSGPYKFWILRLAEQRSGSLQLAGSGAIRSNSSGALALEPSRGAMIAQLDSGSIQIHDWNRGRSVVTNTNRANDYYVYVRTFRR
jgi:hypothetical protein